MEFDASNLHKVAFVKEVITGSNLNVPVTEVVTAPAQEEKPVEAKETASADVVQNPTEPKRKKVEASAPAEAPAPVEAPALISEEPTTKEMQDLIIGLIKSGELSRDDVQEIFQEFGGTSLMKIAPTKFALLKQRLTTYKNG